jgi:signal transduction histidine kinase
VTYNEDAALTRLHAVSRAPINGIFQHQVGLGIVGGRLYQGELEGVEGARVAARILRGEPASSFPPLVIGTREPIYDWRELARWQFDERRLPERSIVLFRQPTAWQRYRWHVLSAVAVIATQSVFIVALVAQLRWRRIAEAARRRAEADAQQKREVLTHLSRVAALGELTATLAHETAQPLTAILANSSAAVSLLDGPKPDLQEVRATLADIGEDADRASEVIRRLRAMLKRADAPDLGSVDLNDVIRTVGRIVRSDAVRHGITVHLDLSSGVCPVTGDNVQLQQVVLNLMLNAFSAIDAPHAAGGTNEPGHDGEARRVSVRARLTDDDGVLVQVRDSGTGIPPDKLESIFEPFVSSKPDGLGMGLAICRSIIDGHGGRIWARTTRTVAARRSQLCCRPSIGRRAPPQRMRPRPPQ